MAIVPAGHMTEAEYRERREAIRATYGDTAGERSGGFDQALCRLFDEAKNKGWSQERLGKEEKKSQRWMSYRLCFGRFLTFSTTVLIPKNLTERRFRGYWERTDKDEQNDRIRFRAVQKLMEEELTFSKNRNPLQRRPIAKAIIEQFGDGAWHWLDTIIAGTGATKEDVVAVLKQMLTRGTYHTFCERKKGGQSWRYRIVRGYGRKVDVDVLLQKVLPIVQALEKEGRKHVARFSPGTIAKLAHDLKQILEQLAHESLRRPAKRVTSAEEPNHVSTTEVGSRPIDA